MRWHLQCVSLCFVFQKRDFLEHMQPFQKEETPTPFFFSTSPAPACFACFHQQLCTKVFLLLEFTGICLLEWMSCWRKESGFTFIRNFASHAGIALMIMPPSRYYSRTNKGRSWIVAAPFNWSKIGTFYQILSIFTIRKQTIFGNMHHNA